MLCDRPKIVTFLNHFFKVRRTRVFFWACNTIFMGLLGSKGVGSGEGKLGDLERTLSKIYPLPTLSLEGKNSNFARCASF